MGPNLNSLSQQFVNESDRFTDIPFCPSDCLKSDRHLFSMCVCLCAGKHNSSSSTAKIISFYLVTSVNLHSKLPKLNQAEQVILHTLSLIYWSGGDQTGSVPWWEPGMRGTTTCCQEIPPSSQWGVDAKHFPAGLCSREEMFVWEGNQHCETRLLLVFWQGFEAFIVWTNYSLLKQNQWGERKRNAKDDIYFDSSAGEFAILACHNLHLHLHFNCSVKTFALEQIQKEHTWNMHPHTDTGLGWMPNLLQW